MGRETTNAPVYEGGSADRHSFLHQPRSWDAGGQGEYGDDPVRPRNAQPVVECIQGEADDGTAESAARKDNTVGKSAFPTKILGWDDSEYL